MLNVRADPDSALTLDRKGPTIGRNSLASPLQQVYDMDRSPIIPEGP